MNSLFGVIEPYAGDPILLLNDLYRDDPRLDKVNLGIGIYVDEEGRIPLLPSVRIASQRFGEQARGYLPMEGHPLYRDLVCRLVLGDRHPAVVEGRVVTVQTLGGTGGISLAADFLAKHCPNRRVYISDPSWENHHGLFQRSGFGTATYPYWDPQTRSLDFDGMTHTLEHASEGSIVVIQPICHNPTGLDLDQRQEALLTKLLLAKRHLVVFDMAYQGFGSGFDDDAGFVRRFAERSVDGGCLIVNSFSKNLALYGERCGGLTVVCRDNDEAERALGQLKQAVRRSYSTPPITASALVTTVLGEPDLFSLWSNEVRHMRERMLTMRRLLAAEIQTLSNAVDTAFLLQQHGMFSFTGYSTAQVARLREEGIYLVGSGRMCVAGLTPDNIRKVAGCFTTIAQSSIA
ncbi:aspartate/tyrosine/aromatic aminotransferase [Bradyrhizobium sp. CB82]|uniref:amino acid aminotransferase n=1 Tax=Bradyrhizobium sp. CB82 TaxID=3039159 RepID=UPI0024B11A9D|nr:amino acid aminotransferase [Bradyrhizobium sp. CB82]WFU44594.1 aspartate/tyrosine/aromatic aminotransferase [Bradyrhizobium sp. CB82]